MIARRAVVWGRVQGVGFRWSTRAEAERLGCSGWVRNRPDGSVEVLYQGGEDAVAALERWLARGPRAARVVDVTATDAAVDTTATGFSIR